jgi:transposase
MSRLFWHHTFEQMLTPRQIKAIRQLHWIKKWPLRQIQRHVRVSRKTIKKYILGSSTHQLRRDRTSKLDQYKPTVAELLQQDSTLKPRFILQHLRTLKYRGGMTILRDYLKTVRKKPSGPPMAGSKQEAFDWMRALLQGTVPDVQNELKQVGELDKLVTAVTEGRLSIRNKAMAVLARARGIRQSYVCSFLFVSQKTATRYWKDYQRGGTAALFARKPSARQKFSDSQIQEAVFALLHCELSVDVRDCRPGFLVGSVCGGSSKYDAGSGGRGERAGAFAAAV